MRANLFDKDDLRLLEIQSAMIADAVKDRQFETVFYTLRLFAEALGYRISHFSEPEAKP